jgi:antitoxin ParD1/3/4
VVTAARPLTSDYVRDMIRRDQERADKVAALQRLVDETEESSVSPSGMGDILAKARLKAGGSHGV